MKKNKSILWGWTMSYLCVLLIPLLSVFINYYNNEKMLKREYMNAFSLSLSNLENSIASIENNMRNYHHYTIIDETFDRLRKSTEKNSDFYYNTYEFQKTLALYDAANTSLNCAVYYDYLEYISSSSNSCSILQYYDRLRVYSSLIPDYENWLSFLGARYDNDYLVHTALSNDNNPHLIYAHTLVRGTGINSTIFITVSLAELSPMLQHLPDGTFFVIQSTDHQLYSLDNTG